jgi:hypothetical protein
MPMMAKMVHTAKQTVKAMVDIHNARPWPATLALGRSCMESPVRWSVSDYRGDRNRALPVQALRSINNRDFPHRDILTLQRITTLLFGNTLLDLFMKSN